MASEPSRIQAEVLCALAGMSPAWTLTGGVALVLVYLGHRATRDLDLFFHGHWELGGALVEAERRLHHAGIQAVRARETPTFARLNVTFGEESLIVDLVANPAPNLEPPVTHLIAGQPVLVDTAHEILVNKLCAVLSRTEVRDLEDIQALVASGGDLERALADAPNKDGGFTPLTLSWLLQSFDIRRQTNDAVKAAALEAFRDRLVALLLANARPEA